MTDKRIPLVVTYGLVMVSVFGTLGIVALAIFDKAIPVELMALSTAALGGLTALLASTRSEPGPV